MPRDRLPGCRRDLWRCSWLAFLVEVGEALSGRAGIHAQRGEEFGRRVGARQIKQGTERGPQAGPAVLAGVMNAREDALSRRGQPQPATGAHRDRPGGEPWLDADRGKRLDVQRVERPAGGGKVAAERFRRWRGRVDEHGPDNMLGADRAIPAPDRFVPGVVIRGAEVVLGAVTLVPCLDRKSTRLNSSHLVI